MIEKQKFTDKLWLETGLTKIALLKLIEAHKIAEDEDMVELEKYLKQNMLSSR